MPQAYIERRRWRYDNQDSAEDWQYRYNTAKADFHAGLISIDVFRAKLKGLGFGQRERETEVNLNWPEIK